MISEPAASSAPISHLSRSAKFAIPARAADWLRRPRLLDFLHQNLQRKLILISATAGYGKSALLTDFAHDTDYPVAWLRLDEGDADLTVLMGHLVTALQRPFPKFQSGAPALAAQPSTSPEDLAAAFNREMAARLDEYFAILLDDFHLIAEAPTIAGFFDALLAELPEQAHLVMAGRTIPPLKIAPLAARQQLAGLSEEHLRFTAAEVRELLQLRNRITLPEAEAEKLVADTEGWITGILLTTHLMWQGLMASLIQARQAEGPLYDYLAAEVLDQQPAPLRQFLLESAVLPEVEPAVCDAVLGRADSAECLRQAEARRLFVSAVGDEFRAYQYHHLFRDFLLARLRAQDPERLRRLQIRAADWYAENGMAEAAVTFYALAGQLPQAAAVAEANAQTLFEAGRHATLRRWAEQLAPLAHDVPTLYLSLARADIDGGDLAAAEVELETAALGFARHADEAGALKVEVQRSMVRYQRGEFDHALAIAQVVVPKARTLQQATTEAVALRYAGLCQFALGQLAAAEESLQQVVQLLQEPEQRYNLAWTLNDLALVMRARGQTAQAARAQQQALTLWHESAAPGPLALALNNIGWDLHMLGQYQAALATYDEALDWAQRAGNIRLEALIVTGRADVLADLGHRSIATELYRQAIVKAERADDWALTAYLCRAMARLDRWDGKFVSALEWLRRAVLASRRGQATSPLANLDGLRGMILVEIGHVQEGRPILAEVCADLERLGALVDLAQTLLFLAYAEFRAGEAEAAQASLARALAVAEQVGYDQMLVSEALSVRDLLEAFRHQSDIGPRVALLLARAERMSAAEGKTVLTSAAPLSSRPEIQSNATLQICALGSSRVQKMGFEIPRTAWVSQRTRELFFFLIDRAPIPRDQVLEVFWPEKPPARALANLYQTLYRMRRAIGTEVVILEDQECRLSPTLSQDYDVQHFEAEAQAALSLPDGDLRRLSALNAAIQLYTGEYLADLPVGWAGARRQSLNDLHVNLLGAYADALMGLTRYAEAREVLSKALDSEPLRDDLHERMLVCLSKLGRRHAVVDHYRRYRETLRADLGLDPPPKLRALYSSLIE